MKYLVKNKKTGEETLCEKVEVDRLEYYVTNSDIKKGQYQWFNKHESRKPILMAENDIKEDGLRKLVIATNNKSLDLPQVVDEVVELAELEADEHEWDFETHVGNGYYDFTNGFEYGHKKAKETYQFTKDDMVEFALFCVGYNKVMIKEGWNILEGVSEHLLDLWQEQRTIKIESE